MVGPSEFGTTWRQNTASSGRPRARAATATSDASTCTITERSVRVMTADSDNATVRPGSARCASFSPRVSPYPDTGKRSSRTLKRIISISPSQNGGIPIPSVETMRTAWSPARSRFRAATAARGIAMMIDRSTLEATSAKVGSMREPTSGRTSTR